jgi:hypothetical protein
MCAATAQATQFHVIERHNLEGAPKLGGNSTAPLLSVADFAAQMSTAPVVSTLRVRVQHGAHTGPNSSIQQLHFSGVVLPMTPFLLVADGNSPHEIMARPNPLVTIMYAACYRWVDSWNVWARPVETYQWSMRIPCGNASPRRTGVATRHPQAEELLRRIEGAHLLPNSNSSAERRSPADVPVYVFCAQAHAPPSPPLAATQGWQNLHVVLCVFWPGRGALSADNKKSQGGNR